MNVFQLGIRSVVRKPVKSMLLLLIVFVSASFIYAGFACQNASIQTQNEGKQAIGGSFRLEENEANRKARIEVLSAKIGESVNGSLDGYHQEQLPSGEWMVWTDNSFETLTYEDIVKISEVDGVSDFNITTANTVVNPVNFQRIEDKDVDQSSDQLGVSLRGNLQMKYDFDVQNGNIVVNDGRMMNREDKDVCVISRELAELNGLKVGDRLEFNNWKERETSTAYSAEIIGIYDFVQKITPIMSGDSYRAENIIFTDLRFPEKAEGCEDDPLYQYATFWVEDVNEYETVRERIKSVDIEWEKYDFLDNTGMSDTMAENFNDLSKVSSLILVFVMVSSVLILLFVFLFWMKNRVHEMGVLLSIGKGKGTIVLQVLMEGLLIGAVAFVLATFSAPFVSKQVADYLVGYQIQEELERNQAEEGMVAKSVTETESSVVGVSVNIGTEVGFFTAISTMGMIVVSVLGSGIYIASQKPKDILSRMS